MALTKITTKLIEDSTITNADISASFVAGISGSFTQDMTLATASIAAITASVSSIRTDISTNLANMTLATASIAAITASVSTLKSNVGQALNTDSAVTFATVDTGQGANELYDMDQNVLTTSSPTFANTTVTGTLTATEVHTQFVSASITKTTGSNVFGDEPSDRHQFTGSAFISSSITAVTGSYGRVEATNYTGDGSSLTGIDIPTAAAISGSVVSGVSGSVASTGSFGRVEAAGDVELKAGNLIIGTHGKGIDFSANTDDAGGMTSEILDDYEEGTFTAVCKLGGSAISNYTTTSRYTKIGRVVYVSVFLAITGAPGQTGAFTFTGLPFTIGAASNYHCFCIDAHHVPAPDDPEDVWVTGYFLASGTSMHPRNRIGGSVDDSDIDDACDIVFTGFYQVD